VYAAHDYAEIHRNAGRFALGDLPGIIQGRIMKKTAASKTTNDTKAKTSGKRELIAPNGDKRYVRRDDEGEFSESVEVGRSLAQDVRQHAKTKAKPGQGDRGDRG